MGIIIVSISQGEDEDYQDNACKTLIQCLKYIEWFKNHD